jgi:hypothetical protein
MSKVRWPTSTALVWLGYCKRFTPPAGTTGPFFTPGRHLITFAVNGKQYIAVLAGSAIARRMLRNNATASMLFVFTLLREPVRNLAGSTCTMI